MGAALTHPIIGSKYEGPSLDRPSLRQMPRHWILEEAREDYRPVWYRRVEIWILIIAALWMLAGFARIGGQLA